MPPRTLIAFTYTLALALVMPSTTAVAADSWRGKVVSVADGDTVTVLRGKTQVRVRLYSIDTPEKAQPFGQKAKTFTTKLVAGKQVKVEVVTKDRDGHTVAKVYRTHFEGIDHYNDGSHAPVDVTTCLNEELVRTGLAWWYRQYARGDKKLAALEAKARKAKRGLWADPAPVAPWNWRRGKRTKPWSKDKVCKRNSDCVFAYRPCPLCPPCKPTWRAVTNRAEYRRRESFYARRRIRCMRCKPCPDGRSKWLGKAVCVKGQCTAAGR